MQDFSDSTCSRPTDVVHRLHPGRNNSNFPQSSQIFNEILFRCLLSIYRCITPASPHMQRYEARLATFDERWKQDPLKATPAEIAKAGMFFLGEGDRTKCWYCNGGLQHWEVNDNPMEEHAKWFPSLCKKLGCHRQYSLGLYLYDDFIAHHNAGLACDTLGPKHIERVYGEFPNISRPRVMNGVDYQKGLALVETLNSFKDSIQSWYEDLQAMGFVKKDILDTVDRRWKADFSIYYSVEELIDDLTRWHADENFETDWVVEKTTASGIPIMSRAASQQCSLANSTSYAKGMCAHCQTKPANLVCMPCGHLNKCSDCTSENCHTCETKIEDHIRIYVS